VNAASAGRIGRTRNDQRAAGRDWLSLQPGLATRLLRRRRFRGCDFTHGKPDPDVFLIAGWELGVEPCHAVVLKSVPAGGQVAMSGGVAAIGIARR
jgi:beta-phosphoglucomutase-like phosphatase (HAD superfamily)